MNEQVATVGRPLVPVWHGVAERMALEMAHSRKDWKDLSLYEVPESLHPAERVRTLLVVVPDGLDPAECERRIQEALTLR